MILLFIQCHSSTINTEFSMINPTVGRFRLDNKPGWPFLMLDRTFDQWPTLELITRGWFPWYRRLPSIELTYPAFEKWENILNGVLRKGYGYASSQEVLYLGCELLPPIEIVTTTIKYYLFRLGNPEFQRESSTEKKSNVSSRFHLRRLRLNDVLVMINGSSDDIKHCGGWHGRGPSK